LFNKPIENLIPESGNLAQAYKYELIDRAEQYPYIQLPIINRISSQQLSINPNNLNYLSIGTELSTGEKQRLFIIPDTIDLMTLNANLGYQDSYLYSSAYHYWNHYTEIQQYYHQRQTKRPLIFIDLDSFGTLKLVPVKIEPVNNSTYKIPVLNTIETIEVNYDFQGTYPKICYKLAQYILSNNFPMLTDDHRAIIHLSKYLQKNNIFAIIQPYLHSNSIDLIIEILSDNQIYYKQVNLLVSTLIAITLKSINFENLAEIANRNREYQFVLISQYNNFVEVKQRLSQFICLNPQVSEFKEIWQKKHELSFPLFAIYLDDIEFEVNIHNQRRWIKLSEERQISYEGKIMELQGYIADLDIYDFGITAGREEANLPIHVNGNNYLINNLPQDYKIEIQNYQKNNSEEVRFTIKFNLKPGSFPDLQVTDIKNQYKLKAKLVNGDRISKSSNEVSYSYIHIKMIMDNRQNKAKLKFKNDAFKHKIEDLVSGIKDLISVLVDFEQMKSQNYEDLSTILKRLSSLLADNLLEYIPIDSYESLQILNNTQLKELIHITNRILGNIQRNSIGYLSKKTFLNSVFIFIGKLYNFANYLEPTNFLINKFNIITKIDTGIGSEYIQCLARTAITESKQSDFFANFDDYYNYQPRRNKYLWGYGRIMLWYYNFDQKSDMIRYQEHFAAIINYLLSNYKVLDISYKQNALLSLIYLLTFREHDSKFCQLGSEEFKLAERLCESFHDDSIYLNVVSREKSLNHYFKDLIQGCATEEDLDNLVKA